MHSATAESTPFYEKCKKKISPPKISTDDYSTNTEATEVVLGLVEIVLSPKF